MRLILPLVGSLVASLAASLAARPVAGETRQHGNVIFNVPQGWDLGATRGDGTLILLSDLPDDECEFCRIYITPGTRTSGRADTWVAGQIRRFVDEDDASKITSMVKPKLENLKGRPAAMLGQKVGSDLQILFAIQLFGRMELIGFEASAEDEAEVIEGMTVFQRDVLPMVEGARFVSEGAAALLPAPQPGDLEGVWWGTTNWWSMGLDGMMKLEIDHHWLSFYRNGTFYDGTAPSGTAAFVGAELLARGDMDWGNYRLNGDTLTLAYASGEVETYEVSDDMFQKGDRQMYQIDLLADGAKINGVVSTIFVSGFTPGLGMSGGVTRMTDTTYLPDGTWVYGAYSGASATFENGTGFSKGAENSEAGRYEVKDGLVVLYAEDGSLVRSDYIFKAGATIWIGSEMLK